jgi:tRNA/tmRNA/rRNA uracil-C5-methylase (TrmA/RlmC/RlmD family)
VTFSETVIRLAQERGVPARSVHDAEPLADLTYAEELALKQAALAAFWKEHRLAGQPDAITPAPRPRGYRTTSKRRATETRGGLALSFPSVSSPPPGVAPSTLDRPDHLAVYEILLQSLSRPSARSLVSTLNYVIVRGEKPGLAVVLNVGVFDASVVRGAKQIADTLQAAAIGVGAASLYLDPTGSDYYLEARRPAGEMSSKRLFGPDWLEVKVDGTKLRFPPTVFSQVNGPMLPTMVTAARELLAPLEGRHLIDLYCGYGLFSLTLGKQAARVTGVDLDGPAIEAAGQNAKFVRADARFVAARITAEALASRLPGAGRTPEILLLDPPRQGTEPGVVEALGLRGAERVLHVCCGTDEIPREVEAWARAGYLLRRAQPLDVFAGTTALETMLLLSR